MIAAVGVPLFVLPSSRTPRFRKQIILFGLGHLSQIASLEHPALSVNHSRLG